MFDQCSTAGNDHECVQAATAAKLDVGLPKAPEKPKGIPKSPSAMFLNQFEENKKTPAPAKDLLAERVNGLYVCLISIHGLVRGDRMELGKDPDTGGQASRYTPFAILMTLFNSVVMTR